MEQRYAPPAGTLRSLYRPGLVLIRYVLRIGRATPLLHYYAH